MTTSRWTTGIDYVVLGLGMGCLMQMMSLIAQNSVELKDKGVASSARMFFQQMGGSLGVAAFGAVFAHKLTESMSGVASAAGAQVSSASLDPATVTISRLRCGRSYTPGSRMRCRASSCG